MVAEHLGGGVGGKPGRPKEKEPFAPTPSRLLGKYARGESSPNRITFTRPPQALPVVFQHGSYEILCGLVSDPDEEARQPMLVAVCRNIGAKDDVPFVAPSAAFVRMVVAKHGEVGRRFGGGRTPHTLPDNDEEMNAFLSFISE